MKEVRKLPFAEYLKAPGISQSRLKLMGRSPAHFRFGLDEESVSTRDKILGHIFHTAVLEPDLLEKSYYLRPDTYEGHGGEQKKWSGNSNVCKAWLHEHRDREILLSDEHEAIIAMRKSVLEHPGAREALAQGESELSLFCTDPDTGIGLKCRCDRLSGEAIVDLKSTEDASREAFAKSILKFGYDVQGAYNLDIANWIGLRKETFVLIAVEKQPPYAVAVYFLDERTILKGREKYRNWLSLLSYCMEYDEWPAYDPAITPISLPEYAFRRESGPLLLTA